MNKKILIQFFVVVHFVVFFDDEEYEIIFILPSIYYINGY